MPLRFAQFRNQTRNQTRREQHAIFSFCVGRFDYWQIQTCLFVLMIDYLYYFNSSFCLLQHEKVLYYPVPKKRYYSVEKNPRHYKKT